MAFPTPEGADRHAAKVNDHHTRIPGTAQLSKRTSRDRMDSNQDGLEYGMRDRSTSFRVQVLNVILTMHFPLLWSHNPVEAVVVVVNVRL